MNKSVTGAVFGGICGSIYEFNNLKTTDVAGSIAGQYYDIPAKDSEYNISKLSDDLKEIYVNL